MKSNLFAFAALFFLALSFQVFSQENSAPSESKYPKRSVFKFSPAHFFDNSVQFSVETFLGQEYKKSISFVPTMYYVDNSKKTEKGGAVEIQYRVYPLGFKQYKPQATIKRARGIYLGPTIAAGFSNLEYKDYNNNGIPILLPGYYSDRSHYPGKYECQWIMPSILLGFEFTIWEIIYLDLSIGGAMKINDVKYTPYSSSQYYYGENSNTILDRYYKGFLPRAGLTIGVAL